VTSGGASALKEFFVDLATDIKTLANIIRDLVAVLDALNKAGENLGGWIFKATHETAATDRFGNRIGAAPDGSEIAVNAGQYAPAIEAAEKKYNLPEGLLARVAKQESGFNPNAISSAGARGIMQLLPQYFPGAGKDADTDIDTAAKYLASLYRKYGNWTDAVAAYNAGPGAIDQVKAGTKKLPKETRNYVGSVLSPNVGALAAARGAQPTPALGSAPPTASTAGPSSNVQIDSITVNTQATDADSMAAAAWRAVQRKFTVASAEPGLV
jgi:hypothetical protein